MLDAPPPTPFVVLLDDRTLADDLFVRSYGRLLAGVRRPLVFVHGDGGNAARALEAAAVDDAPGNAARALAARMLNRKLAAAWADAGAVVTGLSGDGRALFRRADDGTLAAHDAPLRTLVGQRVTPLVASVAQDAGGAPVYAAPAEAADALARAWGWAVAVFTRPGGARLDASALAPETLADYAARLADADAALRLAQRAPLLVTTPPALLAPGEASGTWVRGG